MTDLDFMGYKKSSSSQIRIALLRSVTLSRMVGTARLRLKNSPKGESKCNGEVERAVQTVHALARTLKDFLEQQSGITLGLEARCWAGWWSIIPIFCCSSTRVSRTLVMRLKGKPSRVEMPSFDE